MEKNFNMGNGEEGGVFKMNDALFDDAPKEVKIDRDEENRKNAEEMRRRNEEYTARIKGQNKIEEKVEEKVLEDTKELNRHEIMRQKIAELNAKNEAWSQKVKEETDKNKKVEDEKVLDRNEVNQRNAEAMRLQNEAWVARGMKFDEKKLGELPAGGFRADKKELSDKAKSMRAYEEKKARQEEEMLRDKTKYLEKYDTRMKGKTAAGKFISKMAGWLGFWDKNRVGRGEELKQKEGEFYNSLENYVSLSDRVSKIQSDILSGKRKNAKGETKEYSQEVLERYRAKMARLELVRLGKEQKDVAGKRAETWNQIEENTRKK